MSVYDSGEGESFRSLDDEQINEFDDEEPYLLPDYFSAEGEESSLSAEGIRPRWRIAPRSPPDFYEKKSSISSCKDSDYEAWLKDYYDDLLRQGASVCLEKQVDTSDLPAERPREVVATSFPPVRKDPWTESTKYWGPEQVRRHWPLRKKKGEVLFLPAAHPLLNLSSRYGRFQSQLNSAAGVPEHKYKTIVCSLVKKLVEAAMVSQPQLLKVMIPDSLFNLRWFDSMTKTTVVRGLCKFFRSQNEVERVYLENMDLDRVNGLILLCALSRNGGDSIKELHMWKMFGHGQCPVLLNELTQKGENLVEAPKIMKYFSKIHYFQILNKFTSLTHLSVNYAYLANKNGEALLSLKCVRTQSLRELRLLCLRDERPLLTNPGYGVGGWKISDGIWRRVAEWCPLLRVKFVFLNLPQYENVIVFLSKSIPVSSFYMSSGVDFNFETPWEIDTTLLELRNWYGSTLETLCLHLWHHRDLLDFVIRKKILEEFPNLLTFEFIGILEDVETLEKFCCQLSTGNYKLRTLMFWVQEQNSNKKKLSRTKKRVAEIRAKYSRKLQVVNIDADLRTFAV